MGTIFIVLLVVILALLYFRENNPKEGMKKNNLTSNSENAQKVKSGNYNLDSDDPLKDYIEARQEYNFTGNVTSI